MKEPKVKVSVIVPVYNAEKYLDKCLESLSKQTLPDIEFICIDNASADNSKEIISKWADTDKRFVPIFNKKNLGQNGSMAKALKRAKGVYVAECDSDDFVAPNMYERLYSFADIYDCNVVQCGFYDYWDDKLVPRNIAARINVLDPLKSMQGKTLFGFLAFQPHLQSAIYKKQFLIDNNIFLREGGVYEDTCFSFKVRTLGNPYGVIPECLYYYRKDNPSSGTATLKNIYGICEQYDEIKRWNEAHKLNLDIFIAAMRYYTYRWMINRIKDSDALQEFLDRASDDFSTDIAFSGFFEPEDWEDYQTILMRKANG